MAVLEDYVVVRCFGISRQSLKGISTTVTQGNVIPFRSVPLINSAQNHYGLQVWTYIYYTQLLISSQDEGQCSALHLGHFTHGDETQILTG